LLKTLGIAPEVPGVITVADASDVNRNAEHANAYENFVIFLREASKSTKA
jgi:hypothetical protein